MTQDDADTKYVGHGASFRRTMMKMPSVAAASAAMGYAPGPATANETSAWGLVGIAYICHASSPGRATHAGLMSETRNRKLLARIAQVSLSVQAPDCVLFCHTPSSYCRREQPVCFCDTPWSEHRFRKHRGAKRWHPLQWHSSTMADSAVSDSTRPIRRLQRRNSSIFRKTQTYLQG